MAGELESVEVVGLTLVPSRGFDELDDALQRAGGDLARDHARLLRRDEQGAPAEVSIAPAHPPAAEALAVAECLCDHRGEGLRRDMFDRAHRPPRARVSTKPDPGSRRPAAASASSPPPRIAVSATIGRSPLSRVRPGCGGPSPTKIGTA